MIAAGRFSLRSDLAKQDLAPQEHTTGSGLDPLLFTGKASPAR
jgi:hypothetical protein